MTVLVRSEAIYRSVFDDAALAALPAWLARAAGARSAVIQWRHTDAAHEVMAFSYFAPAFMDLYASSYAAIDPWAKAALAAPSRGEMLRLDRYVPPHVFQNSRFNREFVEPQGDDTSHCACAVFSTPWGEGMIGVHRGAGDAAFAEADLAPLNALIPHLRRALHVRGELAAHRRDSMVVRDALDDLTLAAIIVRGDGHVAQLNLAADAVLRRADGLRVRGRRLACPDPSSGRQLRAALAMATDPNEAMASTVALNKVDGGLSYLASVTPLGASGGPAYALIVFRDPEQAGDSLHQRLRELYGLTGVEAAIAIELCRGRATSAIAASRGVKIAAIRKTTATLAGKMGCHGEAQIAARVAGLPHA